MGSAVGISRRSMVEVATARGRAERFGVIVGNILATGSCCWLLPFAVPNTTHWEQLRVNVLTYGVIVRCCRNPRRHKLRELTVVNRRGC